MGTADVTFNKKLLKRLKVNYDIFAILGIAKKTNAVPLVKKKGVGRR